MENGPSIRRALWMTGVVTLFVLVLPRIVQEVRANYEYDRTVGSYWELSEKASTLQQKSAYLDQFVTAVTTSGLSGNDAILFPTPDNSYDANLVALKSLQTRMHEIQAMDVTSFAYQTAMQQITAQEQGEAQKELDVFEGLWYKQNHFFQWSWVGGIIDILFYGGTVFLLFCSLMMKVID